MAVLDNERERDLLEQYGVDVSGVLVVEQEAGQTHDGHRPVQTNALHSFFKPPKPPVPGPQREEPLQEIESESQEEEGSKKKKDAHKHGETHDAEKDNDLVM